MKLKSGSGNVHPFSKREQVDGCLDCFNCGAEDGLEWQLEEIFLDDTNAVSAEGLVCKECGDMFMEPEEGARFMNMKNRHEHSPRYFAVIDDEITEHTLQ